MALSVLEYAEKYIGMGLAPIPVRYKGKAPIDTDWTDLRLTLSDLPNYFDRGQVNVGIVLGTASGGTIDVDLDDDDTLRLAPRFVPPTDMIFGRKSRPKSHRIYRVPSPGGKEAFQIKSGRMLVELRGDGHQTVFPGSVHESGELVEFEEGYDFSQPQETKWDALVDSLTRLSISTVFRKCWGEDNRHHLALHGAGYLAVRGWSEDDVAALILAVAEDAGDNEVEDRIGCVRTTFERWRLGEPLSQRPALVELIGNELVGCLDKWTNPPTHSKSGISRTPDVDLGIPVTDLLTDADAARTFANLVKDNLIYCDRNSQWYKKEIAIYRPISAEEVQGLAVEFVYFAVEGAGASAFANPAFRTLKSRARINATIELSRAWLRVPIEQLDADDNLAGCNDGHVLNLSERALSEDETVKVTKRLGTYFDPEKTCPEWNRFLRRIFDNDTDLISFIQRAVGYSLTGDVSEQCLFLLTGTGANGKSTFLAVLRGMLGDYAATPPHSYADVGRLR